MTAGTALWPSEIPRRDSNLQWSAKVISIQGITAWKPGVYGCETWPDVAADLDSRTCACCFTEGHYQAEIEKRLANDGPWWTAETAPMLGSNGVVWDGHHRIIGAIRVGINEMLVHVASKVCSLTRAAP